MKEEEVVVFSKTLDEMILMITDKNRFAPFKEMEIGQILGFPYITTRSTDVNLKYVNAMKINEFSIIEQITGFPPQELPYLIMSFIEQSKDFKSETYLVDNNIFAHVEKIGDDYLTLLYELTIEDEVSQKAKLKLINSFTIIDKENKFTLIKDDKSEFAIKLEQLQFEEVNKRFTENLKFDIIA